MVIDKDEGEPDSNFVGWSATDVTSERITIQLEFDDPLKVSADDLPNYIIVQSMLSDYPDEHG